MNHDLSSEPTVRAAIYKSMKLATTSGARVDWSHGGVATYTDPGDDTDNVNARYWAAYSAAPKVGGSVTAHGVSPHWRDE